MWRRWSRMGLERRCMPAWVRFWQGAVCVGCSKNMVILCCLWKAISSLFMPEEFRCGAQGSMEKWEAAQTARNGPSELAVNSARLCCCSGRKYRSGHPSEKSQHFLHAFLVPKHRWIKTYMKITSATLDN